MNTADDATDAKSETLSTVTTSQSTADENLLDSLPASVLAPYLITAVALALAYGSSFLLVGTMRSAGFQASVAGGVVSAGTIATLIGRYIRWAAGGIYRDLAPCGRLFSCHGSRYDKLRPGGTRRPVVRLCRWRSAWVRLVGLLHARSNPTHSLPQTFRPLGSSHSPFRIEDVGRRWINSTWSIHC